MDTAYLSAQACNKFDGVRSCLKPASKAIIATATARA